MTPSCGHGVDRLRLYCADCVVGSTAVNPGAALPGTVAASPTGDALTTVVGGLLVAEFGPIGAILAPFVAQGVRRVVAELVAAQVLTIAQGYHLEWDNDNPARPPRLIGPDGKDVRHG